MINIMPAWIGINLDKIVDNVKDVQALVRVDTGRDVKVWTWDI